ncbi:MAG TPA: hypothetical protein VL475_04035 [Planctomycetaceae bacterium]|nr:hypothetical protein [Planctomycetaceae bacterium]
MSQPASNPYYEGQDGKKMRATKIAVRPVAPAGRDVVQSAVVVRLSEDVRHT